MCWLSMLGKPQLCPQSNLVHVEEVLLLQHTGDDLSLSQAFPIHMQVCLKLCKSITHLNIELSLTRGSDGIFREPSADGLIKYISSFPSLSQLKLRYFGRSIPRSAITTIDLKSAVEETINSLEKISIYDGNGCCIGASTIEDCTSNSNKITHLELTADGISVNALKYIMVKLCGPKFLNLVAMMYVAEQDKEAFEAVFTDFKAYCTSGNLKFAHVYIRHDGKIYKVKHAPLTQKRDPFFTYFNVNEFIILHYRSHPYHNNYTTLSLFLTLHSIIYLF